MAQDSKSDEPDGTHETLLPSLSLSLLGRVGETGVTPAPGITPMPPPELGGADTLAPVTRAERGSGPIIDVEAEMSKPRGARRGDVIGGRYVVDGQIGRGGMGRVLRVRHQVLGKAFALKLIKIPIATNPRIREMFYREARLASALSHINICSIVDFGQDPAFGLFMVMELLEGQTLHHKLRHDGALAPKVACDVMWQIAEAVRYIHSRAIIHGDVKSENILLTRTPDRRRVVKLLDFGLARAGVIPKKRHRSVEGTPEYLAPERIRGLPASPASDIYALGILLYELLTGKLPFTGEVEDIFNAHLQEEIPTPSQQVDEPLDERADELVARATAKSPDDRHGDVAGFLYELRTLMNMLGMDVGRRRSGTADQSAKRRTRRSLGHRLEACTEVFDNAPVPLAVVDREGKVRVANLSFMEFLGVAGEAAGIHLADSGFTEVYPALLDDLARCAAGRTVKRIIYLAEGGGHVVEVAVILTPAPSDSPVTAGEAHIALHPLQRHQEGALER